MCHRHHYSRVPLKDLELEEKCRKKFDSEIIDVKIQEQIPKNSIEFWQKGDEIEKMIENCEKLSTENLPEQIIEMD